MDITISIDDQMFQKAYLFAKAMNKTVEQLIYEYFQQFESGADKEIAEFRRLTAQGQGRSKGGSRSDMTDNFPAIRNPEMNFRAVMCRPCGTLLCQSKLYCHPPFTA